jgi:dihydrofolate synthase/folylpolyglutamate synthase
MDMPGDTLEKIAFEKAGIIKKNIPVVIGESLPETKPVFEKIAKDKNAPFVLAEEHLYVADFSPGYSQLHVEIADKKRNEHYKYQLDLPGIYQTKNLVTVLETVYQLQLKKLNIKQTHVQSALKKVKHLTGLHGRWEKVRDNPTVIIDVAHNSDGMKQIAEQLELMSYSQLHIIIGLVKDKDIKNILSFLPPTANYYFTKAQIPRALPENELSAIARTLQLEGRTFADVNTALDEAVTRAHEDDLILICGSVFLAGEVNI